MPAEEYQGLPSHPAAEEYQGLRAPQENPVSTRNHVHWTGTAAVQESIRNGQWKQAKAQVQHRCRTKPETQARRLAIVVGALCDRGQGDQAVTLIRMFGGGQ